MSEKENLEEEKIEQDEALQEEKDEIEELKAQNAELKDKFLRAQADFENIKKRLEKEKISALAYANENFAKDLLDVIDALEAALNVEANDEVSEKIKEGVKNTLDLFLKKLEKHGVKIIEEEKDFNPNLHEAMFHVDSAEHSSSTIVQVLQKGYKINDRVLRHTKVSVAK